jgi:hypothetical protein
MGRPQRIQNSGLCALRGKSLFGKSIRVLDGLEKKIPPKQSKPGTVEI